jgi:methylmalonyl-CoA/ethylmalonyl-CoA epimerase
MAKLRHIAISVPDPEKSAQFYEAAFGLTRVGTTNSPLATGVYLSDGVINVALLKYKSDEVAGKERGKEYVGLHHFGFHVDDLDAARRRVEQHGATFFMETPHDRKTVYFEEKYRDQDGIIFDISHTGWKT